jgi:hypothetical protein
MNGSRKFYLKIGTRWKVSVGMESIPLIPVKRSFFSEIWQEEVDLRFYGL